MAELKRSAKVRAIRFFILPTLLGWAAAYLTCCVLNLAISSSLASARDYGLVLIAGGLLIVVPSYVTIILPLSFVDWSRAKKGRSISVAWYCAGLLAAASAITVVAVRQGLVTSAWFSGRLALFCVPFIPFALVVVTAAKYLLPRAEKEKA